MEILAILGMEVLVVVASVAILLLFIRLTKRTLPQEAVMQKDLELECPCTMDCRRHGDCVLCREHHAFLEMPSACLRPEHRLSDEHRKRVEARLKAAGLEE